MRASSVAEVGAPKSRRMGWTASSVACWPACGWAALRRSAVRSAARVSGVAPDGAAGGGVPMKVAEPRVRPGLVTTRWAVRSDGPVGAQQVMLAATEPEAARVGESLGLTTRSASRSVAAGSSLSVACAVAVCGCSSSGMDAVRMNPAGSAGCALSAGALLLGIA